jgi:hypothetical protein
MDALINMREMMPEIIPTWYLIVGGGYAVVYLIRAIQSDFSLILQLCWRATLNTFLVPMVMGIFWPVSILMSIADYSWNLRNIGLYGTHKKEDDIRRHWLKGIFHH